MERLEELPRRAWTDVGSRRRTTRDHDRRIGQLLDSSILPKISTIDLEMKIVLSVSRHHGPMDPKDPGVDMTAI